MYALTPNTNPNLNPNTQRKHPHHQPFTSSPEDATGTVAVVAVAVARLAARKTSVTTSLNSRTLDTAGTLDARSERVREAQYLAFSYFRSPRLLEPLGRQAGPSLAQTCASCVILQSLWAAAPPSRGTLGRGCGFRRSSSRHIYTLTVMRQSSRESHVPAAADQTTCRDDKLMVVLLLVSAGCCGVENDESPWTSTCGYQKPSEAAGMEEEPAVVGLSSSPLSWPKVNLGLTTTTKYSSYSNLWRMLFFVNDAPFRIHKRGGWELQGVT